MITLIRLAAKYPIVVIVSILVITVVAFTQIEGLKIHVSAQGLIAEDDPARQQYQKMLDTFGSSDSIVIIIRDKALFSPKILRGVNEVSIQLSQLNFVTGTDSLFTLDDVRNEDDNILFFPFLGTIPETEAEADKIKKAAWANPFISGSLLSIDGQTMAINVRLKPAEERTETDEQIVTQIEAAIGPIKDNAEEVFALGLPYVLSGLSELIVKDQRTLLPLSMVALLAVLLVMLRRASAVIMPFITAIVSVIWTLALMAMLDIPLNIMTSIVPALLVIIGSTEDIHLLSGWYRARSSGENKQMAIEFMASSTGLAVLLTFITTYLGFLSIAFNNIHLLQQFGIVASTGLLFNFIITTLLLPALLSKFCRTECKKAKTEDKDRFSDFASFIFDKVGSYNFAIIVVTCLMTAIAIYGAFSIKVDNDNMSYFNKDAPIHHKAAVMHKYLAGMQSLDIVLDSHIDGTFTRVKYLEEIHKLQRFLNDSGYFDKTLSFADYIALINRVMEDLDTDQLVLPEEDALVREYLLFIDSDDVSNYVDNRYSKVRIQVRHNISSSRDLKQAIEAIQVYADENLDKGLDMLITGESMLSNEAADRMVTGQILSLLFMLVVIFLVISALFLDFKAGLMAAVPNIFPVILLFGVMGFFEIPLNTGTIMVAAIAIGICVDDTMHFLVSYNREMRHYNNTEEGILAAMKHEARPIMSTSIALALGFGVLAFSNFPPVVHFGLLSAMVIMLAVIANFILMPVLLCKIRIVTIWDVLGVRVQSRLAQDCELFAGMKLFEIRKLIAMSQRHIYESGDVIMHYGDQGDEIYVVLSGSVNIRVPYKRETDENLIRDVHNLETGAVFGEVAFIGKVTRTADVIANERTELLSLKVDGLRRLNRFLPGTASRLYFNISKILAKRLV